jgi:hypothetical protein
MLPDDALADDQWPTLSLFYDLVYRHVNHSTVYDIAAAAAAGCIIRPPRLDEADESLLSALTWLEIIRTLVSEQ